MPARLVATIAAPHNHGIYADLFTRDWVVCYPLSKEPVAWHGREFELAIIDCDYDTDAGLTNLKSLKTAFPDVPVICVAAFCTVEFVRQVYRTGARDFFCKPFSADELVETVHSLLELKLAARERRVSLYSPAAIGSGTGEDPQQARTLPERLQRVLEYIEDRFDKELYLDQLADIACLSKYHFCRLFKQHLAMTPMQFIAHRRIEHAKLLIAENHSNFSSIALMRDDPNAKITCQSARSP